MTPTSTLTPPAVEALAITKCFGSFTAVDQVSLRVAPGTFHALLGENGAGKSTLVKCLMGYQAPDAGEVMVGTRERAINSPADAQACGLGMVYQHFTLVPAMTVAENLVMSRADLPWRINWRAEHARIEAFLQTAPFRIDPHRLASSLAAGEKQKVEILKQLYLKAKFLILDEPTSVLTPLEADEVLGLLRAEVTSGRLSVLMITHKFREVFAYCDEVTVLRRGRLAGTGRVKALSESDLARMMLGEERKQTPVVRTSIRSESMMEVRDLWAKNDLGLDAVRGLNLSVRTGEIVGIAGVSGNAQREFVETLAGQREAEKGEITVAGIRYEPTRRALRELGVHLIPEEPLKNACVPTLSVAENLALRTFDRPPQARGPWLLRHGQIAAAARELMARFNVKAASPQVPIATLSGGNVQRAVLARELGGPAPRVLILSNPCFGLDLAAVDFIHRLIIEVRNGGGAVLLLSEDLDEILKLSDRLFVMQNGRLVYETPTATANLADIGRHMAGH